MIAIRPEDIPAAKRVILSVARRVHGWSEILDEVIRRTDFADRTDLHGIF